MFKAVLAVVCVECGAAASQHLNQRSNTMCSAAFIVLISLYDNGADSKQLEPRVDFNTENALRLLSSRKISIISHILHESHIPWK